MLHLPRLLLGALWALTAAAKAAAPLPFIEYCQHHLGAGAAVASVVAWTVIVLEFCLGCLLLACSRHHARLARTGAIVSLLLASAMGVYLVFEADRGPPCGCFGSLVHATRARRAITVAAILFLSAEILKAQLKETSTSSPPANAWSSDAGQEARK